MSKIADLHKKRSSPKFKRFFRSKLGDLQKKKRSSPQFKQFFRPKLADLHTKKRSLSTLGELQNKKNSTILVQITASPSQFLLPNPLGGLFSFLEQKSSSKALKTCYFAYFSGQWGAIAAPPGYATRSNQKSLNNLPLGYDNSSQEAT